MRKKGEKDAPVQRVEVAKPCFDEEEERLLIETLRSGWVTQGPRVSELEACFRQTVEAREAVALSSGTAALFLSLRALGVGAGDEVIVPSLSFIASANAIAHCSATPVFVDVDPLTYNVDPEAIAEAVTDRTRAVMVVHQLGMPVAMDQVQQIAADHGLWVVEDAACALGSLYKGRPIGSSENLACFSFHPRKVVVSGEGGMITTPDPELAARLRRLRHQGMSVSDAERHRARNVVIESYPEVGYNFRLSDLHAAVGLAQLRKLPLFLERRRAVAARYRMLLADLDEVVLPFEPEGVQTNYQSYIIRLRGADESRRNEVMDALQERGVATRRGLMACHREPCHRGARISGGLVQTEAAADQTLLLPIYPELEASQQEVVAGALREVLGPPRARASRGARPGARP